MKKEPDNLQSRREFLRSIGRNILFGAIAVFCGSLFFKRRCKAVPGTNCLACRELSKCSLPEALKARHMGARRTVWQLDPTKCVQCGRCATNCVLTPSAVKCFHQFSLCGYCKLCFGYFQPSAKTLSAAAEGQVCPTGAIKRKFVEDPYYEYTIDESLCIGCGKCVKGCGSFGNGSLLLQVKHDRCVNCNECSIARNCPAGAYKRVSADSPYILKE
jgi:Na+-translocating ferredoxin:NAD+ oxidoreductase subunit B